VLYSCTFSNINLKQPGNIVTTSFTNKNKKNHEETFHTGKYQSTQFYLGIIILVKKIWKPNPLGYSVLYLTPLVCVLISTHCFPPTIHHCFFGFQCFRILLYEMSFRYYRTKWLIFCVIFISINIFEHLKGMRMFFGVGKCTSSIEDYLSNLQSHFQCLKKW
jgi:hypothetical protein